MKQALTIVKIGGNVIDDEQKLDNFLQHFANVQGAKILVHGGGKVATSIGEQLGISAKYVEGRRITDKETLELVTMVYGGLINKKIVAALQGKNCNAIGLTGADGQMIVAEKRPVKSIDYGQVGDITKVNSQLIVAFLHAELTPIIAPLSFNKYEGLLNTNADTIAQEIAKAMAAHMDVLLIYCFEKKGLLENPADENSAISTVTPMNYAALKEDNIVSGGMIPKLDNAFAALGSGVSTVMLGHADDLPDLVNGIAGTKIMIHE